MKYRMQLTDEDESVILSITQHAESLKESMELKPPTGAAVSALAIKALHESGTLADIGVIVMEALAVGEKPTDAILNRVILTYDPREDKSPNKVGASKLQTRKNDTSTNS